MWEVEVTNEFLDWWLTLSIEQQEAVTDRVGVLSEQGPDLGWPIVDRLRSSVDERVDPIDRNVSLVIHCGMVEVSIRELRNHGGDVVDRVARGEHVTVTRRGKQVAELRPLSTVAVPIADLVRKRAHLPYVDPERLRYDLDTVIDASI